MRILMLNLDRITGGASGLNLPTAVPSKAWFYEAALVFAAVAFAVAAWVRGSRFGLGLRALRLDQEAAESLGVRTALFKNLAHVLSAFLVGACGGLFATYFQYVHPDTDFSFTESISLVLICLIGGLGTLWGPVVGAVIFFAVQNYLQTSYPNLYLLVYGVLLILVLLFEPRGLVGLAARLWERGRGSAAPRTPGAGGRSPGRLGGGRMSAALALVHVTKRFGGLVAVHDVSVEFAAGQITGLIGPNGAGKTTLFRIASGHTRPSSGAVFHDGVDITGWSLHAVARRGVCATHQIVRPFVELTVLENVLVAATFGGGARLARHRAPRGGRGRAGVHRPRRVARRAGVGAHARDAQAARDRPRARHAPVGPPARRGARRADADRVAAGRGRSSGGFGTARSRS